MTTYVERVVTEVAVEPESPASGAQTDQRWTEIAKIEAVLKGRARQEARLNAEGFDD